MGRKPFPPQNGLCPKDGTHLMKVWEALSSPKGRMPYYMCRRTQHIWNLDGSVYNELTDKELLREKRRMSLKLSIERLLQSRIRDDELKA